MRATEVKTEPDMVSRWATAALSDTIASLGTLTPGAMTTKIPCLALTKAAEALKALEGALPHINEADTQKIKTRLKVALSELEETWTVAVCNHAGTPHKASDFFNKLIELKLMPGITGTSPEAAADLLRQVASTTGCITAPSVMLDANPITQLGSVVGRADRLTITGSDDYYIITENGDAYIRELTFTGDTATRARLNRGTLHVAGLTLELQQGEPSIAVEARIEKGPNNALRATIEPAKASTNN